MLTSVDEGKPVVNTHGEEVGRLVTVEDGSGEVTPGDRLSEDVRAELGWTDDDQDSYRLEAGNVASVTDSDVRLVD
jgi:hypothetical protein